MSDGTTPMPELGQDRHRLYVEGLKGEGTKTGPTRMYFEKVDQSKAIRLLTAAYDTVIYAAQLPDGTIKIGCTANLAARHRHFRAAGGSLVGFMPGTFEDETALHRSLRAHIRRGREWYYPTPEVFDVVNGMRDAFNLPHLAA